MMSEITCFPDHDRVATMACMWKFLSREPLHDPTAAPLPEAKAEVKTTTCYMCACRCGIRVHLRDG
jgi:anaerobic selenocysteine-containing dehydrogenase